MPMNLGPIEFIIVLLMILVPIAIVLWVVRKE